MPDQLATPNQVAERIRGSFGTQRVEKLENVIAEVLQAAGLGANAGADEAGRKLGAVLAALRRFDPRELDFFITEQASPSLVGKQRGRSAEPERARRLRLLSSWETKSTLRQLVYELGAELFVGVSVRIMLAHGASSACPTGNTDEGGIDLYGRMPLRMQDQDVPQGLLSTTPLVADLFFVAQCKCYNPHGEPIGPSKMNEFDGAVRRCLAKYEGEPRKPTHRVPDNFYRANETAVPVYFTTAAFTGGADSARRDIILIDGIGVAEFLLAREIAVTADEGEISFDRNMLEVWAREGLGGC